MAVHEEEFSTEGKIHGYHVYQSPVINEMLQCEREEGISEDRYRIMGIIRERKYSRIVVFFLIHEKMFAHGDNRSRICSFLVQLPISPLATPIFSTKVATVEALQSSSYSGHTHLKLLNRVNLSKHSNLDSWIFSSSMIVPRKLSNPHPSDFCWNTYRNQVNFSVITALCLSRSPLSWNK